MRPAAAVRYLGEGTPKAVDRQADHQKKFLGARLGPGRPGAGARPEVSLLLTVLRPEAGELNRAQCAASPVWLRRTN